jgi:cobalt-zinc-cadmium efflux system membrane fusion protein
MSSVLRRTRAKSQLQSPPKSSASETESSRTWLRRSLPGALTLAAIAALAVWGHESGWSLPKLSALWQKDQPAEAEWCAEHNVLESQCIECNVALSPPGKDYGWCKLHGVAECTLEHPEIAELKKTPEVMSSDLDRARRALALLPRAENSSRCTLHHHRVQFASAEAADKAGVDIDLVGRQPIVETVTANGEIVYDQTRAAHLASRVPGTVWRVDRGVGETVKKGDVLALIDAVEVGRAKGEFLQALAQMRLKEKNADRLQSLTASGSIPERTYREAETAREEAQIRLLSAQQMLINLGLPIRADELQELSTNAIAAKMHFLGLPEEVVEPLSAPSTTSNLFPIKSPLDGILVERNVVAGEVVDNSRMLFVVADVSRMWLTLDVRQEDTKLVALGQSVRFRQSGSNESEEAQGKVVWISTAADQRTRTVKVRVDLPNSDGRLRAHTFGTGRIVLRAEADAITVPSEAVHSEGCCQVVFVRDRNYLDPASPKFFHIRKVRVGVKDGKSTEILSGVLPGEVIATKGSNVLAAQLLKSKLGEGCGCAHGHQ